MILVAACSFLLCFLPFSAYAADYPTGPLDYKTLDYTIKEGIKYNTVSVPLNSDFFTIEAYTNSNAFVTRYQGMYAMTFSMSAGTRYNIFVYPTSNYGLLLADIPEGSYISFDLTVNYGTSENFYVPSWAKRSYYVNANNSWVSSVLTEGISADFGTPINVTFKIDDVPSTANAFVPSVKIANIGTALAEGSNDFQVIISNVQLVMDISTGYWEQWLADQTGEMIDELGNEITGAIEDSAASLGQQIEDSNSVLGDRIEQSNTENMEAIRDSMWGVGDQISTEISSATNELMNGGPDGELLDQKDDALTDTADVVNDGLASIESFQGQYMDAAAAELQGLVSWADLTMLAGDMNFVQKYTNKIFDAIPDAYVVVFTLPLLFGIVMYILGHPVRAPRPDTSGDEITRQMTTTTEVLQGRHAGQVTVTRTTTTSQEIGRVHKE